MNKDLYQALILDHNKNPQNFGGLEHPDYSSEGFNPLCGDHYRVDINIDKNTLAAISFEGTGCAISKASASLMTEAVKGLPTEQALSLVSDMQTLITTGNSSVNNKKLLVFSNIKDYPSRAKCASLAWHTLKAALNNEKQTTTE